MRTHAPNTGSTTYEPCPSHYDPSDLVREEFDTRAVAFKGTKVTVRDSRVRKWRVNLAITFIVKLSRPAPAEAGDPETSSGLSLARRAGAHKGSRGAAGKEACQSLIEKTAIHKSQVVLQIRSFKPMKGVGRSAARLGASNWVSPKKASIRITVPAEYRRNGRPNGCMQPLWFLTAALWLLRRSANASYRSAFVPRPAGSTEISKTRCPGPRSPAETLPTSAGRRARNPHATPRGESE